MKNAVFWDAAPCRSCVNQRFGGTYRLYLQGRKIRERETSVSSQLLNPQGMTLHTKEKILFVDSTSIGIAFYSASEVYQSLRKANFLKCSH
jgi:hypothetical protein